MAASLLLPPDPATLAKGITDVLVKEAKETAMNRDAIAALRRRSVAKPTASKPLLGSTSSMPAHNKPVVANNAAQFATRPERRIRRRLRSLPDGSTHRQQGRMGMDSVRRRTDTAPPTQRDFIPRERGSRDSKFRINHHTGSSGGVGDVSGDNNITISGGSSPVVIGDRRCPPTSWPNPSLDGGCVPGIPADVRKTNALPSRLSCGYCRKWFHVQVLDRHEDRCPSRNPELFATPCVGCGFQGPRCACWALRNGLLKERRRGPQEPLFKLFRNGNIREGRGGDVAKGVIGGINNHTKSKGSVGCLGGWKAGEGLRRPTSLIDNIPACAEEDMTAEEMWIRERDDWLFGRTATNVAPLTDEISKGLPQTPPLPRAPVCGTSDHGNGDKDAGEAQGEERDEAFSVRERRQMCTNLENVRDAARVRQYNERWFRFSISPPEEIRHQDIPWLPRLSICEGGVLCRRKADGTAMVPRHERIETLGVNEGDSSDVKKAALRAASLRWHPDKFMSKYGPRIPLHDRAKIAKDVEETMQRITKIKERLQLADETKKKRLNEEASRARLWTYQDR